MIMIMLRVVHVNVSREGSLCFVFLNSSFCTCNSPPSPPAPRSSQQQRGVFEPELEHAAWRGLGGRVQQLAAEQDGAGTEPGLERTGLSGQSRHQRSSQGQSCPAELCLSVSVSLCLCLSVCLCLSLSQGQSCPAELSVSLSLYISVSVSLVLCLCLSVSVSLSLSLSLALSLSV